MTLLEIYGTDFGMIALHMKKTRDQIKRKYVMLRGNYSNRLDKILVEGKVEGNREKVLENI